MTYSGFPRRVRATLLFITAALSLGLAAGTASAATTSFSNPAAITIFDAAPASPYPSTINVAGLAGNVQKVTATLTGFDHTYPDDLAVLLVGPSGANTILMGRVGGDAGSETGPVNLTFDQASPNTLNEDDTAVSGTYQPSEGTTAPDPLSSPAPPGPTYPVNLGVFNGTPANGAWNLFIEDQDAGDSGIVSGGWSLNVTAPVNSFKAGKAKLNKKNGSARVPVTTGDAGILKLSGKGVKSKKVNVPAAGTVKLVVKPKGKTSKQLNSTGSAKVKVKIAFTPTGGTSRVQTKKIKLKK